MGEEEINLFSNNWDKVSTSIVYYGQNYSSDTDKILLRFIQSDNKSWSHKGSAADLIGQNSSSIESFEELLKVFSSTNSRDFKLLCERALHILTYKIDISSSQIYQQFLKKEKISCLALYDIRNHLKWTKENWFEKLMENALKTKATLKNQYQTKFIYGKIKCTENVYALIECLIRPEEIILRTGIKTKMIHVAANYVNDSPYISGFEKGRLKFFATENENESTIRNVLEYIEELEHLEQNICNTDFKNAADYLPEFTHRKKFTPHEYFGIFPFDYYPILNFAINNKDFQRSKEIAAYMLQNKDLKDLEYLKIVKENGY